MVEFFLSLLMLVYFTAATLLMLYGLNCYVMLYLFRKWRYKAGVKRKEVLRSFYETETDEILPSVTTQIPVYNEFNVAERVIRAACAMDYPAGKHEIHVLDDSDDETKKIIDETVKDLSEAGHDVSVIRRNERTGYKAGALAEGMKHSRGNFIAIFDADFIPPDNYLLNTVPFFLNDPELGLVQARWGHLNFNRSFLTRAQSIGIDGHFMIEQSARNWSGLYMNFNGTAGVWRKEAITDGGGWNWDTLTEDMDLSYRVQFKGWKTLYIPDLVVPAEIPEDICSFKSQQFRWAKGSIQTAKKHLPEIVKSDIPVFKKIEAFFHLTHYFVHPLMAILSVLTLPVVLTLHKTPISSLFFLTLIILIPAMVAPSALYVQSQLHTYGDWFSRLKYLPFLVVIGTGLALSNSRAVVEALAGRESGFIRTPKRGDKQKKKYRVKLPWSSLAEVLLGIYCAVSLSVYMSDGQYIAGPFLAIYTSGFLFTGILSFKHTYNI